MNKEEQDYDHYVSIDYLLDYGAHELHNVIKEVIDLQQYEKTGRCCCKEDAVVMGKYPNAVEIIPLLRKKKLNKFENILDLLVQPGIFELADY